MMKARRITNDGDDAGDADANGVGDLCIGECPDPDRDKSVASRGSGGGPIASGNDDIHANARSQPPDWRLSQT